MPEDKKYLEFTHRSYVNSKTVVNLIIKNYIKEDKLEAFIEKDGEVLWEKNHIQLSYTVETKDTRRLRLIKLAENTFREVI